MSILYKLECTCSSPRLQLTSESVNGSDEQVIIFRCEHCGSRFLVDTENGAVFLKSTTEKASLLHIEETVNEITGTLRSLTTATKYMAYKQATEDLPVLEDDLAELEERKVDAAKLHDQEVEQIRASRSNLAKKRLLYVILLSIVGIWLGYVGEYLWALVLFALLAASFGHYGYKIDGIKNDLRRKDKAYQDSLQQLNDDIKKIQHQIDTCLQIRKDFNTRLDLDDQSP